MTTATITRTITLTDLAHAVNRLIDVQPYTRNPTEEDTSGCLYYNAETGERCLIGQALYDLTGKNVPARFEETGIEQLLQDPDFISYFGLPNNAVYLDLAREIICVQGLADGHARWGVIDKIKVGA